MKKIKYILLFFYFCLFTFGVLSQPSIQWQKTYDSPFHRDEGFRSICDAGGGNFYIAGYSETTNSSGFYILKINSFGDTIWTRIIGGRNLGQGAQKILPLNDGGCMFTGSNDTAFTIRLNSAGDIVWYKTYPVTGAFQYTDIYDMIKTSDGGYIMCGKIFGQAGCIYKLDSLGNLQWNKIHTAPFSKRYNKLLEVSNSYLIAGGIEYSVSDARTVLIKINLSGDSLWQKEYKLFNDGIEPSKLYGYINTFILFGTCYNPNIPRTINCYLRIDTLGNLLDTVFINSPPPFAKNDRLYDVIRINDNKYVLSCIRYGNSGSDTTYAESKIIDSLGNVFYYKSFLGFEWSEFHSCIRANNGDLLFTGNASRFNQNDFDGYAVRTDSILNVKPFGIEPISGIIPEKFRLYQNYPNPFNPVTNIRFDLNIRNSITLKIYDILGKEVTILVNEELNVGSYIVKWNAEQMPSGAYFAKINSANDFAVIKILLLK